ncbi:hypothetical protein QN277_007860 [Acacia crassicarpa]|uniref:RNase H type-1 domain-containing protein n=1 Tax=Acacia crassicarpa TaxID=499986 RepID=A0AAE1IVK4_9FABA|nr:hypothetical protein QN277_007860 [Acacia crassicarpa]
MSGLKVGRQMGFHKILLYSDSLEAVNSLMRDCCIDHPFRNIIAATRDLIYQEWSVQIYHTHRVNISCADYMAKCEMDIQHGAEVVLIPTVPNDCLHMYLHDQLVCNQSICNP